VSKVWFRPYFLTDRSSFMRPPAVPFLISALCLVAFIPAPRSQAGGGHPSGRQQAGCDCKSQYSGSGGEVVGYNLWFYAGRTWHWRRGGVGHKDHKGLYDEGKGHNRKLVHYQRWNTMSYAAGSLVTNEMLFTITPIISYPIFGVIEISPVPFPTPEVMFRLYYCQAGWEERASSTDYDHLYGMASACPEPCRMFVECSEPCMGKFEGVFTICTSGSMPGSTIPLWGGSPARCQSTSPAPPRCKLFGRLGRAR
jgi:hypothetical protein